MKKQTCPVCNESFETRQHHQTCCSTSCSNKFRAKEKPIRFCAFCQEQITDPKRLWPKFIHDNIFCNKTCEANSRRTRPIKECEICKLSFRARTPNSRFCCRKCMGVYFKEQQISRPCSPKKSFVEVFLTLMLKQNFPNLKIINNDRVILEGFEIDIFLPEYSLGIEVCGPHHYVAINGEEVLAKIQKRDKMKRGLAYKKGIKILTLDVLETYSKTTKTKLINLFVGLCSSLNFSPTNLEVDMSYVDKVYREIRFL
jgi:hypothetical protein